MIVGQLEKSVIKASKRFKASKSSQIRHLCVRAGDTAKMTRVVTRDMNRKHYRIAERKVSKKC